MRVMLDKGAFMPERAHETDAGLDIRTPVDFAISSNVSVTIHTGVHIELPHGTAGIIMSKSGLNTKHDIVTTGLIDEGYTGEIVVKLYRHSAFSRTVYFNRGDKIAQLVIVPVLYECVEQSDRITGGERGDGGFGSTGR